MRSSGLALALLFGTAASMAQTDLRAAAPAAAPAAVFVYAGGIPRQEELKTALQAALAPHSGKMAFRLVNASAPDSAAFLVRHGLALQDAPVLLVMQGSGAAEKVVRRIALSADENPRKNARGVLTLLKLPLPRVEPPAPSGPVASIPTDGGEEEKRFLHSSAGSQKVTPAGRVLQPSSVVVYHVKLPLGVRNADLRAEVMGSYAIEVAPRPEGPWNLLLDSHHSLGAVADLLTEKTHPAASLEPHLDNLRGNVYIRVYPNGKGKDQATLSRLEVVALGRRETSAAVAWAKETERLRAGKLAGVEGADRGTPLIGSIREDTTLTADRSPYVLLGDTTVEWGRTLTVEPGTTIKVAGKYALTVVGRLVAKGTAQKPVTWEPLVVRQPDDWKGIRFTAIPGRKTGEKSVLEYCRLVNAAALELPRFSGEVTHCTFEGGASGITLRDGGTARIRHNRFLRCHTGLALERGAGEITENEWLECGISVSVGGLDPAAALRFENNSIRGSRFAAVVYSQSPSNPGPALQLANNHWDPASDRLLGPATTLQAVRLEPRLPEPPPGVGPAPELR